MQHNVDKERLNNTLNAVFSDYHAAGLAEQVDYKKFYLYSLITHSTAIEGSTVTEVENTLLFDQGITSGKRSLYEINMNLDLKSAYELSESLAHANVPFTLKMLQKLSASVMRNTGGVHNTPLGAFDSRLGEYRLLNVTAGAGGRSYLNQPKVIPYTEKFCKTMNQRRAQLSKDSPLADIYDLSFDAHYELVTIHPWVDGNGRMSRLVMNQIQEEFGVIPSKVTKEHKDEYIQSLIDSRENDTPEPFKRFMFCEHINNIREEIFTHWKGLSDDFRDIKKETVEYAAKYAEGKKGFAWLRDSFNELCDSIIPEDIEDSQTPYRIKVANCVITQCKTIMDDDKISFIRHDIEALAENPALGKGLMR